MNQTSSQVSVSSTVGNQTRSALVPSLNDSEKRNSENQINETYMTTHDYGDDNISPPVITSSQIEEQLVRDDITNEQYAIILQNCPETKKRNVVRPSGFRKRLNNRCLC